MTSSDIREVYDFEDKDLYTAAACLDTFPPVWSHQRNHSGLDCLIVVLRRIYSSHMLDSNVMKTLSWLPKSESMNPILTHAWHVFGCSPDAIERTDADRQVVNQYLHKNGFDPRGSFESLCTSSLMNETFWSQKEFRLTDHPVNAETGASINLSPDEIAQLDILELDSSRPADTLQLIVDRTFGVRTWKEDKMVLLPSRPWVIRVIYRVNDQDGNLSIQDLKTLQMPVWTGRPNEPKHRFQETGRVNYYLLAVVRMRQNEKGRDVVRTYNPTGSNVLFNHQSQVQAIMNGEWSIQDGPRKYMMYYSAMSIEPRLMPDPTGFPEVAQRAGVDLDWIQTYADLMEETKTTLTVPKPNDKVNSQPIPAEMPQTFQPYVPPEFTARDLSRGAKRQHESHRPATEDQVAKRQFLSQKYNKREYNKRN
ncbi:hypothetical protein FSHL1_010441 [Fusarium sambucinum]